jgi:hypothetical protein
MGLLPLLHDEVETMETDVPTTAWHSHAHPFLTLLLRDVNLRHQVRRLP